MLFSCLKGDNLSMSEEKSKNDDANLPQTFEELEEIVTDAITHGLTRGLNMGRMIGHHELIDQLSSMIVQLQQGFFSLMQMAFHGDANTIPDGFQFKLDQMKAEMKAEGVEQEELERREQVVMAMAVLLVRKLGYIAAHMSEHHPIGVSVLDPDDLPDGFETIGSMPFSWDFADQHFDDVGPDQAGNGNGFTGSFWGPSTNEYGPN
jgi:hypothetical protein